MFVALRLKKKLVPARRGVSAQAPGAFEPAQADSKSEGGAWRSAVLGAGLRAHARAPYLLAAVRLCRYWRGLRGLA
eukprot:14520514-Alexandrium_andersonii.AAC.1